MSPKRRKCSFRQGESGGSFRQKGRTSLSPKSNDSQGNVGIKKEVEIVAKNKAIASFL